MPLPDRQKIFDDMSIRLNTIQELDRQIDRTNRWKCHNNIALCMHCMLTCDKHICLNDKWFLYNTNLAAMYLILWSYHIYLTC